MGGERESLPPHCSVEPAGIRGSLSLHPFKIPGESEDLYNVILSLVKFTKYLNFLDRLDSKA